MTKLLLLGIIKSAEYHRATIANAGFLEQSSGISSGGAEWTMCMERRVNLVISATEERLVGTVRTVRSSDKVLWTHWHDWMPADAEDGHWEWDRLMDYPTILPVRFAVYALEADSELQGLMLLELTGEAIASYGIHVNRLATAPWNRPPERRHHGVGGVLLAIAVLRSLAEGHEGRIYLESLPAAEAFYRRHGMIAYDAPSPENLAVFRFTAEAAWTFVLGLHQKGFIDVGS